MSLCYDEEYRKDADIEVAIPISGRITVDEAMEVKTLPECELSRQFTI